MSTYDLCKRVLTNLINTFSKETVITNSESDKPIIANSTLPQFKYRISTTPYRDALMKNVIRIDFENKEYIYYNNLGDKINQIVEGRCSKRSHRYWWVEEYLRESYIRKNRSLQRKGYCVITKPKNGIKKQQP